MRGAWVRVAQFRALERVIWVGLPINLRAGFSILSAMPRYIVEREFPDGLRIPVDENGCRVCLAVVESNLADQVTWVHSYVSTDKKKAFCVYDAPSPEAIRRTAGRSKLPVERITEVRVLDPYFYR
jgi:hypothetical protein